MLNDVSLGRYYETDSVLHRADPRVKLIMFLVYLIAIFMVQNPWALICLALITLVQTIAAKIPPKVMWMSIKPVLPLALFITVLNLLSIRTGNPLWQWKILMITDDGISKAILMSIRLIFLIMSTSVLLTLTTTPLKIADALEKLFSPLKAIKVPVHEMAMMMSIALRFIPTLTEETDKIMKAQMSRGANYDSGTFMDRVKGYITVLIPLFVSSFKRAEELAVAMDARCYRGGEGRTKLNPLKFKLSDLWIALALLAGAVLLVAVDFLLR